MLPCSAQAQCVTNRGGRCSGDLLSLKIRASTGESCLFLNAARGMISREMRCTVRRFRNQHVLSCVGAIVRRQGTGRALCAGAGATSPDHCDGVFGWNPRGVPAVTKLKSLYEMPRRDVLASL